MAGGPVSDYQTLLSHRFDFSQLSRGSGIVYCRGSGQVEGVGDLNPPNVPECLPLFPPLVSSSRGKVVSTTLGAPPPNLDANGIGQSLMTDWDEESVLSNSYSDCHSNTVDSSTMWGRPTVHSSDREQKPWTTEHQNKEQKPWTTEDKDRDGYKSSDKDCDRNHDKEHDRSKKSDN